MATFASLNLHPKLLKAIEDAGYLEPTPIQLQSIPLIQEGKDLAAESHTGSGKTAAFLLPILNRLIEGNKSSVGPRALILAPTRELAEQIADQVNKYGKHAKGIKAVTILGGVPYPVQKRQLSKPYDILIATPGRLIDFLHQRKINLSHIEVLVLDEADRMLDLGFQDAVEEIAEKTPDTRQTLLFTATLEGSVLKLAQKYLVEPEKLSIERPKEDKGSITEEIHYTNNLEHKNKILNHILVNLCTDGTIIFTATKRHADVLVEELQEQGLKAMALHGDMNQRHRSRTLGLMRKGAFKILVATDVAARGIDLDDISHVINFDLPRSVEDYVHRIGRTGRAGRSGKAHSFAARDERGLVKRIENYTGSPISVVEFAGLEPKKELKEKAPFRQGFHQKNKGRSPFARNKGNLERRSDTKSTSPSRPRPPSSKLGGRIFSARKKTGSRG